MTKKKHGFVISWFYPPMNSSEGLVTYKLLKNSGFEYDVWTRKQSHKDDIWSRKTDESKLVADNVKTLQSDKIYIEAWMDKAVEYFEANSDKYDFIMSRIMPQECHEVALRIKRRHPEVKWIASFGDPLVDTPYIDNIAKEENPHFLSRYVEREGLSWKRAARVAVSPTRFANRYVWEKERQIKMIVPKECEKLNSQTFRYADLLIFNNEQQFERAFTRKDTVEYRDKGRLVYHSFDETLYPKAKTVNKGPLKFVYVGHLDQRRKARSLFRALGLLKQHDPKLKDKVRFEFYGHIDRGDMAEIINSDIADIVSIHKDINYLKSLEVIAESDWTILIDANLNNCLTEYIYLPAKLIDYLGAKKNVFAISQVAGTTADVMKRVNCGQLVSHSADEIALYLAKIIYQGYNPTKYVTSELNKFNAKNVAKEFDKIVTELLDNSKEG